MKEMKSIFRISIAVMVLMVIAVGAKTAAAETMMMPARSAIKGTSVVVWGITTLPNSTSSYSFDFGDGSTPATGTVGDGSYIAVNYTYTNSGPFTVTLT